MEAENNTNKYLEESSALQLRQLNIIENNTARKAALV